jgi:hypothetical protein
MKLTKKEIPLVIEALDHFIEWKKFNHEDDDEDFKAWETEYINSPIYLSGKKIMDNTIRKDIFLYQDHRNLLNKLEKSSQKPVQEA